MRCAMQSKWLLGGDIPQTDFYQRAVILMCRWVISGIAALRGGVCRGKEIDEARLVE
jgi:hypothetical protein